MGSSLGNSLISSLNSGLSNTYSYLASLYPNDGVTLKNITAAKNDQTNYLTLNQPFASYLQNNFKMLDKDGDGKISADEMNKFSQTLATAGVSKNELTQLAASGAYSQSTLTKIMENFEEIDKNHDGRVTAAEIASCVIAAAGSSVTVAACNASAARASRARRFSSSICSMADKVGIPISARIALSSVLTLSAAL